MYHGIYPHAIPEKKAMIKLFNHSEYINMTPDIL